MKDLDVKKIKKNLLETIEYFYYSKIYSNKKEDKKSIRIIKIFN